MSLSTEQKQHIKSLLLEKIRKKLANYNPTTAAKPFHYRLLGKERMDVFSFIQSINTMLGMSIFEQVALLIAEPRSQQAVKQYKLRGSINRATVIAIDKIEKDLAAKKRKPDKNKETKEILAATAKDKQSEIIESRVDLFMQTQEGVEYYFELKTPKPNKNESKGIKKQLLEWVALRGSQNAQVQIKTILAITYNPYEPQPYNWWTAQGKLAKEEVFVGEDFWDFIGGKNTYQDLLEVFQSAGDEIRSEIDDKLKPS